MNSKIEWIDPKDAWGEFDENGNRIRFTPNCFVPKNQQGKQKTKYLVHYVPSEDSITLEGNDLDETYFSEWGLTEIKEAYKYVNEDNDEVVNPRWKPYLKPTKAEKQVLKEHKDVGINLSLVEANFLASLR